MKKFLAAVCCTLLIASASFAQSGSKVAPAGEAAMQGASDAAASVVNQGAQVMEAPVAAAPMTSDVVEGTVVNAPMATSYPTTPIQQGCGCGGSAPAIMNAPVVMSSPDMSQSVYSASMAAPITSNCGCGTPAPAPACCPERQRRQPVRGLVSRMGSRRNSQCCN